MNSNTVHIIRGGIDGRLRYKGFMVGYVVTINGLKAAWRSSLDHEWYVGNILVDHVGEIEQLARECIDYNDELAAEEISRGTKLTMEEEIEWHRTKKEFN
jgi:hypothetical protein